MSFFSNQRESVESVVPDYELTHQHGLKKIRRKTGQFHINDYGKKIEAQLFVK